MEILHLFVSSYSFTIPPSLFPLLLFPVLLSLSQRSRTLNQILTEGGKFPRFYTHTNVRKHTHTHTQIIHILDVPLKHYPRAEAESNAYNTEGSAQQERKRGKEGQMREEEGGRGREGAKDRSLSEGFSLLFDSLVFCHFHKERKKPKEEKIRTAWKK